MNRKKGLFEGKGNQVLLIYSLGWQTIYEASEQYDSEYTSNQLKKRQLRPNPTVLNYTKDLLKAGYLESKKVKSWRISKRKSPLGKISPYQRTVTMYRATLKPIYDICETMQVSKPFMKGGKPFPLISFKKEEKKQMENSYSIFTQNTLPSMKPWFKTSRIAMLKPKTFENDGDLFSFFDKSTKINVADFQIELLKKCLGDDKNIVAKLDALQNFGLKMSIFYLGGILKGNMEKKITPMID